MTELVVEETFRKMASIVKIDDVIAHPNADKLEIVVIGGWQCVVVIGRHKKGDLAVYCEIDSLVPVTHPEFAFLGEKGENIKTLNELNYCRIKTMRLRKELSQGLIIHVPDKLKHLAVGTDVSTELGILKYAKPSEKVSSSAFENPTSVFQKVATWIYGEQYTNLMPWPTFLSKSEQPRIQNSNAQYLRAVESQEDFEESVKLDGSSLTIYSIVQNVGIKVGLCSRNFEISQEDKKFTFAQACRRWLGELLMKNRRMIMVDFSALQSVSIFGRKVFADLYLFKPRKDSKLFRFNFVIPKFKTVMFATDDPFFAFVDNYDYLKILKNFAADNTALTFQGELVGPGISDNFEGIDSKRFFVYSVFREGKIPLLPPEARRACKQIGFDYVPVLNEKATFSGDMKDLIKSADGPRALAKGGYREGKVYKSNSRDFSVKVISNKYLDKEE
jgi:RNA ligase (TIGR02306 family)